MENRSKKLFFTILALIFAFALTMLMARFNDYLNIKNIALDLAWKFPNGTTILQRIALQLIIQMGLLILFLIAWWFSKINMYYLLLIFVVVDMFVATRLNSNCTVYYEEFSSKNIRAFEKQNFVKGFPVPDRPITEYSDSTGTKFSVPGPEFYGKLILDITGHGGGKIIQLLNEREEPVRQTYLVDTGRVEFHLLGQGKYKLRAISDLDGNREWTTGDFDIRRQPEPVSYYPGLIEIKENWEVVNPWKLTPVNFKQYELQVRKTAARK